ncbi:hypothetical protein [Roseomonas marmotae]|uniref:Baseplate assembly protein n=1 Tax=Roseomonas marmotae TaxID=2768161 RepID=A0ABS3K6Q2_9PROT|nr:hypothetical protein [Roseomonas marmotae]MBO1073139.1 hypothetical protein [Roseomonas marmotae]QTI79225.1 hypothetical protein IAI58_16660 [Roseomonas marmotae]
MFKALTTAITRMRVLMNQGEQVAVEYPPGHTGNIVGGGATRTEGNGESLHIHHEDAAFARPAPGIPVFTGGSEGDVTYLPVDGGGTNPRT